MKKTLAFVLVFALVFSVGVTAFAVQDWEYWDVTQFFEDGSPYHYQCSPDSDLWWELQKHRVLNSAGMELYNADDNLIATVPEEELTMLTIGEADKLGAEDKEAFLAAYEEAKAIKDKVVKYFCWVDVPAKYKTDDFAWAKFEFKCSGENVAVQVNGKDMEVVHVKGVDYYAKLTEFGAVAILCD